VATDTGIYWKILEDTGKKYILENILENRHFGQIYWKIYWKNVYCPSQKKL
jgi:hypothetical protein